MIIIMLQFHILYFETGVAGLATGLVSGMSPMDILNTLGTAFITNRTATLFILTLPVIGLCERNGLKDKAVDALQIAGQSVPIAVISAIVGVIYALIFDQILKRRLASKANNMTWTISTIVAEIFYCIIGLIFIATGISGAIALIAAFIIFKPKAVYAVKDCTRFTDNVGVTGILPQVLAALGSVFTAAGCLSHACHSHCINVYSGISLKYCSFCIHCIKYI